MTSKRIKKSKIGFDVIIAKTLRELVQDLQQIAPKKSEKLNKAMEKREEKLWICDLQNVNSALYSAVSNCRDVLERDATGRKYLAIFAMVQPSLTPSDHTSVDNSKRQNEQRNEGHNENTVAVHPMQLQNDAPPELKETMADMDSFFQNSQLWSAAENVMKDLNITPDSMNGNMQMTDMMGLAGKMMSHVQEKVSKGELDLNVLRDESTTLMKSVQQNTEFQKFMETNMGGLGQIMNMAGTTGDNGGPNMANFAMNAMQMMNGGGDGNPLESMAELGNLANLVGGLSKGNNGSFAPKTNTDIFQTLLNKSPPSVTTTVTTTVMEEEVSRPENLQLD